MGKYILKCILCGREYEDDKFRLCCDANHEPSLLKTIYEKKIFSLKSNMPGMFKFYDFLPVERMLKGDGSPVTYRSEGFARYLGINNLYIIFNGYWPERDAFMETASFKELEAPSVLARIPENHNGTIVVASAGNTGRAFADICSRNRILLILVVPESSINEIWSTTPFRNNVKLLSASGSSDYFDAITLAAKLTNIESLFPEGGARNVARRDGMATTVLDAALTIGRIPDHYFQAVGSGTGGIAAWESSIRLLEDGSYGNNRMRLHLSQNYPFIPMVEAWNRGMKDIPLVNEGKAKKEINEIYAKVLSNRKPPYSIKGGVYDVLKDSSGFMYSVTNKEAFEAIRLFEEYENIDICPAAGVAVASLIQALRKKTVGNDDCIAVNITGGGEKMVKRDHDIYYLEPFRRFTDEEINSDKIDKKLEDIFAAV